MSEDRPPSDDLPTTRSADSPSRPPERIGPYRVLRKIGEGGMGEVYEAEQEAPVRRKVALKIIKWGMDTKQVVARFEAERQALAMMNHLNIAKVFDAGATEQGRPYFVMEFVKGVPITEHCDRQRMTTQERLELFMEVCEGVQHAHQKAVIHRDIKPSNILVAIQDGKPVPKIIDFGVAKATEQRLTERTLFTELGQLVGTPEYMSPEQAEMTVQDIDTRTDVYSLGVVLYELLVGALPFDPGELRQAGFDEIRRKIRQDDPSKPSTKVSTLGDASRESAKSRRTDPTSLAKQLRGDLDWITMKSLEKDRTRRYGSPNELAADLKRHLALEPVAAGPPGTAYRIGKFLRRHRIGAGITVAAVLVLAAFAATMALQARTIAAERDRANQEAKSAERVAQYLGGMLGNIEPERLGLTLMTELRKQVRETHRRRGRSETEIEMAVTVLAGVNGTNTALVLLDKEILARAGRTISEELKEEPRIVAHLENTLGDTYSKLGLYDAAETHTRRAVEIRELELGRDHRDTLASLHDLATLFVAQGRYDKAEKLYREVMQTRRRTLGDEHPDMRDSLKALSGLYFLLDRRTEAEELLVDAIEVRERLLGKDHEETLALKGLLAWHYTMQGREDEVEQLMTGVLESSKRTFGEDHPKTLNFMAALATFHQQRGLYDDAEALLLEVIDAQERLLGRNHRDTLETMAILAHMYGIGLERLDKAEQLFVEVVEGMRQTFGNDDPGTIENMEDLAWVYNDLGRHDEAEQLYREIVASQRRLLGDDHPDTLYWTHYLALMYGYQGRHDEAKQLYLETLDAAERVLGEGHPQVLRRMSEWGEMLISEGKLEDAEAVYRRQLVIHRQERPRNDASIASVLVVLGWVLNLQERYADAEPVLREAMAIRRTALPPGDWRIPNTMSHLGASLAGQGRFEDAEPLLVDGASLITPPLASRKREAMERVVQLYETWGKPDKAAEWRAKLENENEEN